MNFDRMAISSPFNEESNIPSAQSTPFRRRVKVARRRHPVCSSLSFDITIMLSLIFSQVVNWFLRIESTRVYIVMFYTLHEAMSHA